jgi:glycosyltransferase involved in cell wall biosynthesis
VTENVGSDARRNNDQEGDALDVVMLIQRYLPTLGGAERQLASLVPLLVERGVRVTVITRREQGLPRKESIGGADVFRVATPGPKVVRSLAFTLGALRVIRRLRPQVIHAHDMLSPTTTAILGAPLCSASVVTKVLRSGPVGDVARLMTKPFGARRARWMRRRVDKFVVISHDIDDELSSIGIPADHRVIIPNGVDLVRFRPSEPDDCAARRQQLGWGDAPVAVFTGRLAAEKRVDWLVHAWPRVREVVPGAQLFVVGDGPLRDALRSSATDGVAVVGPVDDVAALLGAADVFVLPSIAEGLSNAMLEAMASGLGIVATRVGGASDVITDGFNGDLVDVDDLEGLESAITGLLGDLDRRARYGAEARRTVAERYSIEHTAEMLVHLYRSVGER